MNALPEISLNYAHSSRSSSPSGDQQSPRDTKLAFLDLLYLAAPPLSHLLAFYQSRGHSRLYYKERTLRGSLADLASDSAELSSWRGESRTGLDSKPCMSPCALALYYSTASSGQNDNDWNLPRMNTTGEKKKELIRDTEPGL
ncbi:hypothetical protein XPA_006385 [Xanthoria parietina]